MSGIFLLVGICGSLAFSSNLLAWYAAAAWPAVPAEITASRLLYSMQGRTGRPDFTFRYEWQGRVYTTEGYDLLEVYTSDLPMVRGIQRDHPVGSRTTVRVNPDRPGQAVLTRGGTAGLVVCSIPLVFALFGLIGAVFSLAGGLGWLDEKSRHPFGRATRAIGAMLLRENVLKAVFFGVVGSVVVGLAVYGAMNGNVLLIVVAGVMAWGTWKASRTPPAE